jgi:heat shock protein HslJ
MMIISCSSSEKNKTANTGGSELLYMNTWKLVEVQDVAVVSSSNAGLEFSAGKVTTVTGNTGCNRFNGSIEITEEHQLKFAPLATTRMACLNKNSAAVELKFLEAISRATAWSADSVYLLLKNRDTVLAKFSAQKYLSAGQAKLNGTWELEYIKTDQQIAQLYPEKKPTIIFSFPDLQVGGTSSCNGYGMEASIEGNQISFKKPISTMMACPGNGEKLFFQAMGKISAFRIEENNKLTLQAGVEPVLRFIKK